MKIFGDLNSGNCLKVKLVADHLGLAYTWVPVDITAGGSRTSEFLAMNPQGQVPTVQLADGRALAQSNAILRYLARGSALVPEDAFDAAKVDEWLFWEQYSHEPYVAVCRYQMLYLKKGKAEREPWRVTRGEAGLDLMDRELSKRDWLAAQRFTIADIALLPYTRLAHEGGFDLAARPHLNAWIERCETQLKRSRPIPDRT